MLATLLLYLPIVGFFSALWIYRSKTALFEFDIALFLALVAIATKVGVQFFFGRESMIPSIFLIIAGALLFILLVFLVGDKISGESTLSIGAAFALAPWASGLIAFTLGMVILIIILSISTMKQLGMSSKELTKDLAHQTGLMYGIVPSLKNIDTEGEGKRINIIPVFLFSNIAIAIGVTLISLFS